MIRTKRAYEDPAPGDGRRVLVDRLWPRGVSKDEAALDDWFKELAPSDELREWFGHDADKWGKFRQRYRAELQAEEKQELLRDLAASARQGGVTLVYGARDEEHNNAAALRDFLQSMVEKG
jgi:uncharacterized protein YeaO (DUF488 family)